MMICLTVAFLNMTPTFTEKDARKMQSAATRCAEVHRTAPCLKSFQKREEGVYRAICGKKQYFDKKQLLEMEYNAILMELAHLDEDEKKEALEKIGVKYE